MSDLEQTPSRPRVGALLASLVRDGWCALRFLLGWRPAQTEMRASVARGALFFPLWGAAGGALIAEGLSMAGPQVPVVGAVLPVLLLLLLSGGRPATDFFRYAGGGFFGALCLVGLLAAEVWAFWPLQ